MRNKEKKPRLFCVKSEKSKCEKGEKSRDTEIKIAMEAKKTMENGVKNRKNTSKKQWKNNGKTMEKTPKTPSNKHLKK